jgi:hypothetical protein
VSRRRRERRNWREDTEQLVSRLRAVGKDGSGVVSPRSSKSRNLGAPRHQAGDGT